MTKNVRGRRAALPDSDRRRPRALEAGSLVVWHVEQNGLVKRGYDFGELACAEGIKRSLAEAFARKCDLGGGWNVLKSSREVWFKLVTFSRFLAVQEPEPRGLGDVSPAVWAAWRVSRSPSTTGRREISKIASFLREHPEIPAATREAMSKRAKKDVATEKSYTAEEFATIKIECGKVFRTALKRIRKNAAHLEQWRSGQFQEGTDKWRLGRILDELERTGRVPMYVGTDGRERVNTRDERLLGGSDAEHAWMRLFMNTREAAALTAALIAEYAWNATPLLEMKVPRSTPDLGADGQAIYRVELLKRRRGNSSMYETRNLTDWGPASPGRLLSQAIEATEPVRKALAALGEPRDLLVQWRVGTRGGSGTGLFTNGVRVHQDLLHNVRDNLVDGVALNLRRLRKSAVVLQQREPVQHSRTTHDQVYVLPDPQTWERAAGVISTGVAEAVESARTTLRAHVTRIEADAAMDTATAGCTDYTHSPFSAHGSGCRASFLLCMACENAVISPRHLPRLSYLLHALSGLRGVVPQLVWEHDWKEHHGRLLELRARPDFTAAEWEDAAAAVTAADREAVDQLLRKGFDV